MIFSGMSSCLLGQSSYSNLNSIHVSNGVSVNFCFLLSKPKIVLYFNKKWSYIALMYLQKFSEFGILGTECGQLCIPENYGFCRSPPLHSEHWRQFYLRVGLHSQAQSSSLLIYELSTQCEAFGGLRKALSDLV